MNVPCSVRTDGSRLTAHEYIGGHPEWDWGAFVIGAKSGRQVRYDIHERKIIGEISSSEVIPKPGGDVALSADGRWFVWGYSLDGGNNRYSVVRRSDGAWAKSPLFSRGPYRRGELRIDPAPRWNRQQTQLLVPGVTADGTRQLHLIEIEE